MKKFATIGTLLLIAGTLSAAEPKEEVQNAIKSLNEKSNYSWKSTVTNNNPQSRFRQGPTEGKTEKNGFTTLAITVGDNTVQAVLKDGKGALQTQDGWRSLTELSESGDQQNPGRFFARILQGLKNPAEQAADLAGKNYGLKKTEDAYTADLNQEALKQLMSFRRGAGTEPPPIRDAAGTVKFWIKDGVLTKYEFTVKGIVNFNGNDVTIDRATTVEIKDIDSTKVTVPEEAKSKST